MGCCSSYYTLPPLPLSTPSPWQSHPHFNYHLNAMPMNLYLQPYSFSQNSDGLRGNCPTDPTLTYHPFPPLTYFSSSLNSHLCAPTKGRWPIRQPMLLWLLLPLPRPLSCQLHLLKATFLSTQLHHVFTSGPHYYCCLLPALPDPSLSVFRCSMAGCLAMTRFLLNPSSRVPSMCMASDRDLDFAPWHQT